MILDKKDTQQKTYNNENVIRNYITKLSNFFPSLLEQKKSLERSKLIPQVSQNLIVWFNFRRNGYSADLSDIHLSRNQEEFLK